MRVFRLLLASWFFVVSTHSLEVFATPVKQSDEEQLLLQTAEYLAKIKSVSQIANYMSATAPEADRMYFKSLERAILVQPIPKITVDVTKRVLYFKGMQPLKIVDLKGLKFSYDEREFTLTPLEGAEKNLERLQRVLFPEPTAFLNWILPSAHAVSSQQKGMLMGVFTAMGIIGMLQCFSGQQNGQKQQQQQNQQASMGSNAACGMGLAALLGLFVAMGMKTDEQPKEIKCTITSAGVRTAQVIGPNGQVYSSVSGLPGQYVTNPPVAGPINYGNQLMQICSNQTALGNINQALAAPILLPPAPAMTAYATRSVAPATKPAPSGIQTQSHQPANQSGDARFLDPGQSGAR